MCRPVQGQLEEVSRHDQQHLLGRRLLCAVVLRTAQQRDRCPALQPRHPRRDVPQAPGRLSRVAPYGDDGLAGRFQYPLCAEAVRGCGAAPAQWARLARHPEDYPLRAAGGDWVIQEEG